MSLARRSRLRLHLLVAGTVIVIPLSFTPAAAQSPVPGTGDTVVGELVQAWAEPRGEHEADHDLHAEPLTWVEAEDGEAVRVPTDEVQELPLGATVEVRVGDEVVDEAAEDGMERAREVLAAEVLAEPTQPATAAASPPYTNEVTVVMVQPPGSTQDGTALADVVAAVDGPVADFWESQSRGAIKIHVAAQHDWRTTTASCTQPTTLWNEVATSINFVDGPGKHLLLYMPGQVGSLPDCPYGLAQVGSAPGDGGRLFVRETLTSLIAHELGHNFGLGHSSSVQCDGAVDNGTCRINPYDDWYDVMGVSWEQLGSLNAPQADRLGLLPGHAVHRVQAGDAAVELPVYHPSANYHVAIELTTAAGESYWIEYRYGLNQDAWLSTEDNWPGLEEGVFLRAGADGNDTSLLLDGTPSTRSGWGADVETALPVGRTIRVGDTFAVTVVDWYGVEGLVRVEPASEVAFPRDLSGDGKADMVAVQSDGTLWLYPATGEGGFHTRRVMGRGWQGRDLVTGTGDWTGDGLPDLIARNPANGDLWLYRGNGAGGFAAWGVIGRGWQVMDALLSPGDWDGDGTVDLLARQRSDGRLWLYPGRGDGGFLPRRQVGAGWQVMTALAATGDFDADGRPDFVARHRDGTLFLYRGDRTGGFIGRTAIGRGWQIMSQISGPGDWDGDGAPDLLAKRTDGSMWFYRGNGTGGFATWWQIGAGWQSYRLAS